MAGTYRSRVAGTGSYLPPGILTNADLEKMVETNDQWITERTGIRRRHMASDKTETYQATSDLCLIAAQAALKDAGLTAQDLDCIIVCTVSGDQVMPSTACVVQHKLGARNVMAFDLTAACSGFVYGLSIADQFIRSGMFKHVLVLGAEVLHRLVNYQDRETCILFGDGAGAWILSQTSAEDRNVIMSSHLHADGSLGDLFVLPAGGSRIPFSAQVLEDKSYYVKMKGREIFKNAVRAMSFCCQEALDANNLTSDEVDWLIPHQANNRIIEAIADYYDFPKEKVVVSVHETGNTSAASIPLAFQMAKEDGRVKRGQTILLTAFGAGLTSGSLLMRY
ncbi:MAG: beta-ketoacyl-ACP synthase III [Pseudobdellovibrionaceae bacterium]